MTNSKNTRWEKMMYDYGYYHQSKVNLITHFIGVPIIVTSVFIALGWANFATLSLDGFNIPLNAGLLVVLATIAFYISLNRTLGYFSMPFLTLSWAVGSWISMAMAFQPAAILAAAGFFGGFALQFIGHGLEGKKPALMAYNPMVAMVTSPLFVIAELGVVFGIGRELFEKVQAEISGGSACKDT